MSQPILNLIHHHVCLAIFGSGVLCALTAQAGDAAVDFNREVRPILSENCFQCHGFDEKARKGKLRLDVEADAKRPAKSGVAAIIAGKPETSELIARISTHDVDDIMPPDTDKKLTAQQVDTLRRWIQQGARYARHWAFEPPVQAPLPPVEGKNWPRNEIDYLVLARLESENLQPARRATPETLLRRISFDLTGLPPALNEVDAFLQDTSPMAYARAVDRLLASRHFGERMAVDWLDAARYADTNGYFGDKTRQMWLWRDWVIDAFNANMPFDRFTIEQLAGDLLPEASIAQRIATGFNRNHMANNESGIIDEEFRTEYVVDRLDATATTWMGLTVGCAQCHDHKYDPISQTEFYQLFAFFNNVPEKGLITKENPPPLISVPSKAQEAEMTRLAQARVEAEKAFAPLSTPLNKQLGAWEAEAMTSLPMPGSGTLIAHYDFEERCTTAASGELSAQVVGTTVQFESGVKGKAAKFDATQHVEADLTGAFDADKPWTISVWLNVDTSLGCLLSKIEPVGNRRGLEVLWQKGRLQINLVQRWGVNGIELVSNEPISSKRWHHLLLSYDGSRTAAGIGVYVDGRPLAFAVQRDSLTGSFANAEPLRIGRRDSGLGFYGMLDELRILQRPIDPKEVDGWFWGERLRGIIATEKRSAADQQELLGYYVDRHADVATRTAYERVQSATKAEQTLRAQIPTTLVMQEMSEPRKTSVLDRGQYDQPGEVVHPDVPAALAPWPEGAPRNRLGFAQWLVSAQNPLTARVIVNRLWQQCFGEGLVRTVNDFGSQGEQPTHPELLDYLAVKFMQSGWDVKAMLKLIVTSATYQQASSRNQLAAVAADPVNRLLARGPRFRLTAEMLRDQALAVSGLLVPQIGGPSVKPYQPPGLWEAVSYNGDESYVADQGDGLWRRSLYTFIKRQAPPPALLAFDGPTREKCTVSRARTNTPLQALLLLNDPTYVEAARVLAAKTLSCADACCDEEGIKHTFRSVMTRPPDSDEIAALRGLLDRQRTRFAADVNGAKSLVAVGASNAGHELDRVQLAAWTVVAQALLNLDEAIVRR